MPNTSANGSSTIVQPVGSQTAPTVLTKITNALRQVFFTAADLKDPQKLYQVLHRLNQSLAAVTNVLGQSPIISGNVLRGNVFGSSNSTLTINHGLGRPYTGYIVINDNGNIWSGKVATLPPGVTTSQAIALESANAGTFDFLVF